MGFPAAPPRSCVFYDGTEPDRWKDSAIVLEITLARTTLFLRRKLNCCLSYHSDIPKAIVGM